MSACSPSANWWNCCANVSSLNLNTAAAINRRPSGNSFEPSTTAQGSEIINDAETKICGWWDCRSVAHPDSDHLTRQVAIGNDKTNFVAVLLMRASVWRTTGSSRERWCQKALSFFQGTVEKRVLGWCVVLVNPAYQMLHKTWCYWIGSETFVVGTHWSFG